MPEYHSIGGDLHNGNKAVCVKCGYEPPAPVVEKPVNLPKPELKKVVEKLSKPKKKKVTNANV